MCEGESVDRTSYLRSSQRLWPLVLLTGPLLFKEKSEGPISTLGHGPEPSRLTFLERDKLPIQKVLLSRVAQGTAPQPSEQETEWPASIRTGVAGPVKSAKAVVSTCLLQTMN
jgi:hypothetical protein